MTALGRAVGASDEDRRAAPFVALLLLLVAATLLARQGGIRVLEARTSAEVLGLLRVVPAQSLGNAVLFPLAHRFVGFAVAPGCSVTFLVAPFCLIAAALIASGRVPPRRGLGALGLVAGIFFAVNQARFVVIVASMRGWGFKTGFELSHVLLGTVLSTLGVLGGILLFVWVVATERRRQMALGTADV